jgi:hypothetical protein
LVITAHDGAGQRRTINPARKNGKIRADLIMLKLIFFMMFSYFSILEICVIASHGLLITYFEKKIKAWSFFFKNTRGKNRTGGLAVTPVARRAPRVARGLFRAWRLRSYEDGKTGKWEKD